MPVTTIPLYGPKDGRSRKRYTNCLFENLPDPINKTNTVWTTKRLGLSTAVHDNSATTTNAGIGAFYSSAASAYIACYAGGYTFRNGVQVGTISGTQITETTINDDIVWLFRGTGAGAYLVNGTQTGLTFTGDTHSNTTIDNIVGATGVYTGQKVSGSGIPSGAYVVTRTPDTTTPTSITISDAATATAAGVTITREAIATIIDSDFPSGAVGSFVALDGYVFIAKPDGKIYNSDLNSVTSWSANNYISASDYSDKTIGLLRVGQYIVAVGTSSVEFFRNTGNPSGSPLTRVQELTRRFGGRSWGSSDITQRTLVSGSNSEVQAFGSLSSLFKFDGVSPVVVSAPETATIMRSLSTGDGIDSITVGGLHILLMGGSVGFVVEYGVFVDFDFALVTDNNAFAEANLDSTPVANRGKVYNWHNVQQAASNGYYKDDGSSFTMTIQTEPMIFNKGKGFWIRSIELLADNQTAGSTTLSISGNDYSSFQTIGTFDLTATRKRLFRGGYYNSHAIFQLTDSGDNAWRGQALIVDWEPCHT